MKRATVSADATLLLDAFRHALETVDPAEVVPHYLPDPPKGRTVVIGAGKASAAMARAVETHRSGDLSGLVVTRYGHAVACRRIEVREAGYPVPDTSAQRPQAIWSLQTV